MMFPDFFRSIATTQLLQVSIVAVCALVIWRLFARNRPHLAHAIWALVLIKCLMPPVIASPTSPFSWWQNSNVHRAVPATTQAESRTPTSPLPLVVFEMPVAGQHEPSASPIIKTLIKPAFAWRYHQRYLHWYAWAIGALIGIIFVALRYVWFLRHLRNQTVVHDVIAEQVLQQLRSKLGIRRAVRLLIIDGPIGPAVLGVFRPTILIPNIIVQGKSAAELEPLIAHELIHVRRGDLWWSWLQSVAKSLWWFHPLVWFAGRMLTSEAESSCDEETISSLGCEPSLYARSLMDVLEQKHRLRVAPALPGVRPSEITSIRIERIMRLGQGSHRRSPRWIGLFMVMAAICILPGAAMVVAQDPDARSQQAKPFDSDASLADVDREDKDGTYEKTYRVADLLSYLKQDGLDEQAANKELLGRLPSSVVANAVPSQPVQTVSAILPAPPVAAVHASSTSEISQHHSGEATRVLKDGRLTVHASAKFHDAILMSLKHYQEFGFDSVWIKMVVLEVDEENVPAVTLVRALGPTIENDAGVEGSLTEFDWHWPIDREAKTKGQNSTVKLLGTALNPNEISRWARTLHEKKLATVLSRPQIMTMNGRAASIHVGKSIPTTWQTNKDGVVQANSTVVESVEVGFRCNVRPRLTDHGRIEIEFQMEHSESSDRRIKSSSTRADGKTYVTDVPVINKATVETKFEFKLDEAVLISGPMRSVQLVAKDGQETSTNKRTMVLLTCQTFSPSGARQKMNSRVKGDQSKARHDAKKAARSEVVVSAYSGQLFHLMNGGCSLCAKGDVETRTHGNVTTLTANDVVIQVDESDDAYAARWRSFHAKRVTISFTHDRLKPGKFSAVEAEMHGDVVGEMIDGTRVTANTIELRDGRVSCTISVKLALTNQPGQKEISLQADRLEFNNTNTKVKAVGNVLVEQSPSGVKLKVSSLKLNLADLNVEIP